MMLRKTARGIKTAPMYIHTFRPLMAHTLMETERITRIDPGALSTTADKLRYYRHLRGLEQKEVAAHIGMSRDTYGRYEKSEARDYYPLDKLGPVAELLGVPLLDLLDDYNRFLYDGQGRQVTALRESMGLSRKEFAAKLGVWPSTVRAWEREAVRITRQTWSKLFVNSP